LEFYDYACQVARQCRPDSETTRKSILQMLFRDGQLLPSREAGHCLWEEKDFWRRFYVLLPPQAAVEL
jgi:hypothetical protein